MGMVFPLANETLQTSHSATLHIAKLSVPHLNTVEVVSAIMKMIK